MLLIFFFFYVSGKMDNILLQGGDPMTVELATHTGALLETRVLMSSYNSISFRFAFDLMT